MRLVDDHDHRSDRTIRLSLPHGATAARLSSETILRAYGLLDKISVDEFIRRKETMIPQKFREVAPMRGAVRLVQHLVSDGYAKKHKSTTSGDDYRED